MTLNVGQMFELEAPHTLVSSLATNTWGVGWTPVATTKVRVKAFEISGAFAIGDLIEVGEETVGVQLNYYWDGEPIYIIIPGAGFLLSTINKDFMIRHQNGANVQLAFNVWGREE